MANTTTSLSSITTTEHDPTSTITTNATITTAQTTTITVTIPSTTTTNKTKTNDDQEGKDVGAIVGGVIGGVVVVVLIVILFFLYKRRHRQHARSTKMPYLPDRAALEEIDHRSRMNLYSRNNSPPTSPEALPGHTNTPPSSPGHNPTPSYYGNLDEHGNPTDSTNPSLDMDGYLKKQPKPKKTKLQDKEHQRGAKSKGNGHVLETKNIEIIVDAPIYGNEDIATTARINTEKARKYKKNETKNQPEQSQPHPPLDRMDSLPVHTAPPLPGSHGNNDNAHKNVEKLDSLDYVSGRVGEGYENLTGAEKGGPVFGVRPKVPSASKSKPVDTVEAITEDDDYENTDVNDKKVASDSKVKYANTSVNKKYANTGSKHHKFVKHNDEKPAYLKAVESLDDDGRGRSIYENIQMEKGHQVEEVLAADEVYEIPDKQ